jgi:hypothetical protein
MQDDDSITDELLADAHEKIRDLEADLEEERSKVRRMMFRWREAADLMVEAGHITNTPYAKRQWIEG